MKSISKLYIKVFLVTGIPFGILMTISDFKKELSFVLSEFLILSASFGFLMSLILVSWHVKELRKMGINRFTEEILSPNQKTKFQTTTSKEELILKLRKNPVFESMNLIESENIIVLKSSPSWRSWGEKIQITIDDLENGVKQVFVSSEPRIATTLVDFGKNRKNIEIIEKLLMKTS